MIEDTEYIINPKSDKEYEIHKLLFGGVTATYSVTVKNKKVFCNCPGGKFRGTCKHKDWVNKFLRGSALPSEVSVSEEVTEQGLKDLTNL